MSYCNCRVTCSCERQNEIYKKDYPTERNSFAKLEMFCSIVPFWALVILLALAVRVEWALLLGITAFGSYVAVWLAYFKR